MGAGKIGIAVATMLSKANGYNVILSDQHVRPAGLASDTDFEYRTLQVDDDRALRTALKDRDAVVSALPYFLDLRVAKFALMAGVHYFDPTEDVRTAREIQVLAKEAETVFVPQCGLAPGFIAIVGRHLVDQFEEPYDVKLRVGALPQFPDNSLQYNLTWSTDGLINEYCNPCETIHEGERREVLPLEGLERL